MSSAAELSALSTALADLIDRIGRISDDLTGAERDRLGQDLYEVERSMVSAARRLKRALDGLPPP